MDNPGYFRTVRERWLLIFFTAVFGTATALVIASAITPTYLSSATMFLTVDSSSSLYERSQFSLQRIKSYPDLVKSPKLVRAVIADLGLPDEPADLTARLTATNPVNTVLLQVDAEAAQPDEAAAIANSAAAQLSQLVDQLENRGDPTDDDASSVQLNVTLFAQPVNSPTSPNTPVLAALGLLGGLAIGLVLALLLDQVRPVVRTHLDIRRNTGLPTLGYLPWSFTRQQGDLLPGRTSKVGHALREVTLNLRSLFGGKLPGLVVLNPVDRRSKASRARIGISRTLAEMVKTVILVEVEPDGGLASLTRIPLRAPGFSDVMDGASDAAAATVHVEHLQIDVMPFGSAPSPLLYEHEDRFVHLLGELVARSDVAVIQMTAAMGKLSSQLPAEPIRGAILLASFGHTSTMSLRREVARLRTMGVVPVGVVILNFPFTRSIPIIDDWRSEDVIHDADSNEQSSLELTKSEPSSGASARATGKLQPSVPRSPTTRRAPWKESDPPARSNPATTKKAAPAGRTKTPRVLPRPVSQITESGGLGDLQQEHAVPADTGSHTDAAASSIPGNGEQSETGSP